MAIEKIVKRDGKVVEFQPKKITQAIFKAMHSSGIGDIDDAEKFTEMVLKSLDEAGGMPTVEDVQDIVIKMLLNEEIDLKDKRINPGQPVTGIHDDIPDLSYIYWHSY